MLWEQTKTHMN